MYVQFKNMLAKLNNMTSMGKYLNLHGHVPLIPSLFPIMCAPALTKVTHYSGRKYVFYSANAKCSR